MIRIRSQGSVSIGKSAVGFVRIRFMSHQSSVSIRLMSNGSVSYRSKVVTQHVRLRINVRWISKQCQIR